MHLPSVSHNKLNPKAITTPRLHCPLELSDFQTAEQHHLEHKFPPYLPLRNFLAFFGVVILNLSLSGWWGAGRFAGGVPPVPEISSEANPCQTSSQANMSGSVQFSSVSQSCLTLCDPLDCSRPGLPVHHQLPEFTQTRVH